MINLKNGKEVKDDEELENDRQDRSGGAQRLVRRSRSNRRRRSNLGKKGLIIFKPFFMCLLFVQICVGLDNVHKKNIS